MKVGEIESRKMILIKLFLRNKELKTLILNLENSNKYKQMYVENDLILSNNFTVTSADSDMYRRLSAGALANFLIQSAINSADKLGFGFANLNTQKLFWVLSRMTIEIYKPLRWYEQLIVETWPKSIDGLLYTRDFNVFDSQRIPVAKATTGWLAIDAENKKPKIFEGIQAEMLVKLKNNFALDYPPIKLQGVHDGTIFETKALYSDIDLNGHVTSKRYIDWVMDTFEPEFHKQYYANMISINFMKETMIGNQIQIIRNNAGKETFEFEAKNMNNLKTSFRANISFQHNK